MKTTGANIFHNLSAGEIADRLRHAKAEAAEIKAREGALRGNHPTDLIAEHEMRTM
jgi:hypothetical protein